MCRCASILLETLPQFFWRDTQKWVWNICNSVSHLMPYYFPQRLHHFTVLPTEHKGSNVSTSCICPSPFISLINSNHLNVCEVIPHCGFNFCCCDLIMLNLFHVMCFCYFCIFLLARFSIELFDFCCRVAGVFIFLLTSSHLYVCKYFLSFHCSPFHSVDGAFDAQKFLILICPICLFYFCCLWFGYCVHGSCQTNVMKLSPYGFF